MESGIMDQSGELADQFERSRLIDTANLNESFHLHCTPLHIAFGSPFFVLQGEQKSTIRFGTFRSFSMTCCDFTPVFNPHRDEGSIRRN